MQYPAIATILEEIYECIHENTLLDGTIYETVEELEDDILTYIDELKDNSGVWIPYLDMHFEHNGSFMILVQNNNWEQYPAWRDTYKAAKRS